MKDFFQLRESKKELVEGSYQKAGREIAAIKDPINQKELSSIGQLLQNLERQGIMQKGQTLAKLGAQLQSLDTDVRELVYKTLKKHKLFESVNEAVALFEKLKVSDGIEAWIKDFQDSDAPQFKGKDKEKRREMAIAAFKDAEEAIKENVEDEMPASPDEASMAMKQAEFIMYVGREIGEHIQAGKEFPEWMQNKLSALHQKAKDMHSTLGAHGMNEEGGAGDEGTDALVKKYKKDTPK